MNNNRRTSQPASPRKPSTSVTQSPKAQNLQPQVKSPRQDISATPPVSSKPFRVVNDNQATAAPVETVIVHDFAAKATPSTPLPTPQVASLDEPTKPKPSALLLRGARSPPLPQKPTSFASQIPAAKTIVPFMSPTSGTTGHLDIAQLLSNVFDEAPSSRDSPRVNTQAVLDTATSRDTFPKIKTLRKQIMEITDNGKTLIVPSQHEHFLFEDSLYLCSHVFGTATGQRMTEVYLWCGDGASPSAIEDAQLFAKRFARDNTGLLIVVQQGKETSSFFQALGGIVITRRGRAPPSSSARYILRGRQHIGQVAFDEVDYIPSSLSSGFPHIIAPGSGPLYLWKGKGASADEIGCARLIGMDLGEVEEIDEGAEPAHFWKILPSSSSPTDSRAPYWQLKPQRENYGLRLFRVETEQARPKSASSFMSWGRRGSAPSPERQAAPNTQIREVVPFANADIDEGVSVLDTFFEIFVIHALSSLTPAPHRRSRHSAAFRAACLFAQEYAILAASAEDRPGVPQVSVTFLLREAERKGDEVPEGLRTAFRKWESAKWRDCRCFAVTDVLAALGASREV